jgi:hypothetical protein
MKKTILISLVFALFFGVFAGCSNNYTSSDEQNMSNALSVDDVGQVKPDTVEPTTTETGTDKPITLDKVSINFPEEFTVRTGEQDADYAFQRQYRSSFYGTSIANNISSVSSEALSEWGFNELESNNGIEPTEPRVLSFIKKFDVPFDEFERETKTTYLFYLEMGINLNDEDYELPNPELLYTFDLERINAYYSLNPEQHANALQWLEKWLQTNQPYETYSAYKKANSQ